MWVDLYSGIHVIVASSDLLVFRGRSCPNPRVQRVATVHVVRGSILALVDFVAARAPSISCGCGFILCVLPLE